jgi:hypothetical protein
MLISSGKWVKIFSVALLFFLSIPNSSKLLAASDNISAYGFLTDPNEATAVAGSSGRSILLTFSTDW